MLIFKAASTLVVIKFLGSSMAEHAAVNRRVVGSSPTRGAQIKKRSFRPLFLFKNHAYSR